MTDDTRGTGRTASGDGWFLPLDAVNSLQADTIQRMVSCAKGAHYTDVNMRVNGENAHFQADWIKHMRRVEGAPSAPADKAAPPTELLREVMDALEDLLNGWRYIRQAHGDLYGVGWDRAESKGDATLAKLREQLGEQS